MSAAPVVLPVILPVILPKVWAVEEASSAVSHPAEKKAPRRLELVHGGRLRSVQAAAAPLAPVEPLVASPAPEVAFYRKYTEGILRRYMKLSMEKGRAPSLLGRELFRGHVTSYKVRSFDDVVIFVHDVGRCIEELTPGQQHLLRRIALQEYTQGETAALTGLSLRTVVRRYGETLDRLTRLLLDRNMLKPMQECRFEV